MYYFAYGSNMSPRVMDSLPGVHDAISPAQLLDYRIAFTRKLSSDGSGAADVVTTRGFTTWGIVYKVDEACLAGLDIKEGNKKAYERESYEVRLLGGKIIRAITYTVVNKINEEICPDPTYFNKMIEGAKYHHLPKPYIEFLTELSLKETKGFRDEILVAPTFNRKEAQGFNIVKVAASKRKFFTRFTESAISYKGKSIIVRVIYDDNISPKNCEVDEGIRRVMGIHGGRFTYGEGIRLEKTKSGLLPFRVISPRSLALPIQRPSVADSEKKICVLHIKNIHLLGIEEGDYVKIRTAVKKDNGKITIRSLTRRAFSGTVDTIKRKGKKVEYPKLQEFYIDLDGRLGLGLKRDDEGFPVIISPDLGRLFAKRILYYGTALFLSFLALNDPIKEIIGVLKYPTLLGTLTSLLLAITLSLIFTLLDIRARVQY